LFGILKENMKDREFQSQQAILSAIAKVWDDSLSRMPSASSRNGWSAEPGSLGTTASIIQTEDMNGGNGLVLDETGLGVKTFFSLSVQKHNMLPGAFFRASTQIADLPTTRYHAVWDPEAKGQYACHFDDEQGPSIRDISQAQANDGRSQDLELLFRRLGFVST
jgi:hypothetical protein